MILPDPEKFLTACEYQHVPLGDALGDELFLALHLIMKGCNGYMERLKNYHRQQKNALPYRALYTLSELKMCELKNYDTVPSPEEIRDIVAECVTATAGFAHHFTRMVMVVEEKDLPGERNNIAVLKKIKNLPKLARGMELAKALRKILRMPASAVGACHSFHCNEALMQVAMRQFGIALMVVHDDDPISDRWPYQTPDYLNILGSGVFLPLTFGLIHLARDGHLAILRRRSAMGETHRHTEPCYEGYALDMKTHIRKKTKHVNLMTGVFDLGYTAFADYIHNPRTTKKGDRAPKKGVITETVTIPNCWSTRDIGLGIRTICKIHAAKKKRCGLHRHKRKAKNVILNMDMEPVVMELQGVPIKRQPCTTMRSNETQQTSRMKGT